MTFHKYHLQYETLHGHSKKKLGVILENITKVPSYDEHELHKTVRHNNVKYISF